MSDGKHTLDLWVQAEKKLLDEFLSWWMSQRSEKPEDFPISDEEAGSQMEWDEHFVSWKELRSSADA